MVSKSQSYDVTDSESEKNHHFSCDKLIMSVCEFYWEKTMIETEKMIGIPYHEKIDKICPNQ